MKTEDGGSAFPEIGRQFDNDSQEHIYCSIGGMTLRDYFAAQVQIDGELSVKYAEGLIGRKMPDNDTVNNARFWADVHARLRFISADAMIAARDNNGEAR